MQTITKIVFGLDKLISSKATRIIAQIILWAVGIFCTVHIGMHVTKFKPEYIPLENISLWVTGIIWLIIVLYVCFNIYDPIVRAPKKNQSAC